MKQLKTIFTGIALAVMPTIAQAQAHIESAYKTFLKENEVAKYEFRKEQREDKAETADRNPAKGIRQRFEGCLSVGICE